MIYWLNVRQCHLQRMQSCARTCSIDILVTGFVAMKSLHARATMLSIFLLA